MRTDKFTGYLTTMYHSTLKQAIHNSKRTTTLQGGPKSKKTTKLSKSRIKSYYSLPMRLAFFVKLKYQSSTVIVSVGISYSLRDLLRDVNNYV